jgi:hypothetical protein
MSTKAKTLKPREVREMDPVEAFTQGVDDYMAGLVPKGWDKPNASENPYLAGWIAVANQENHQGFYAEET